MSIQINDKLEEYIKSLQKENDNEIERIERYARERQIPIMEEISLSVMLHILKLYQPKKILEIGSAVGYSAIRMAKALPETKIFTIERERDRYEEAFNNIQICNLEDQIKIYFGDALDIKHEVERDGPFDALFIDASKGQYQRFFETYEPLLTEKAVVFSDNVLFRGLIKDEKAESRRLKSLARKIEKYNKWLMTRHHLETVIIPVGDGLAFSIKRGESL